MTKKIIVSILVVLVLATMCLSLMGCGTTTFGSITGIDNFKDISKIVIVNNVHTIDGLVAGSFLKEYELDADILAIYNVLSRAEYRAENVDSSVVSKYIIRVYVDGKDGYIEYSWDKGFARADGYNGKLKEGTYSMDEADKVMAKLEEIYYRD